MLWGYFCLFVIFFASDPILQNLRMFLLAIL